MKTLKSSTSSFRSEPAPTDDPSKSMLLSDRALAFCALVTRSEYTDADGKSLAVEAGIARAMAILSAARERNRSVYLVGNGGSAGIASHATVDFVNVAKLRAHTVHDPALLTCMSNDYGYENGYAKIMSQLAAKDDVLVAISSSGKSPNIRNAVTAMKQVGGTVITLSGFDSQNPLRSMGELNIWLDSRDYGMVEIGHQFILHNLADRFGQNQGKK